MMVGSRFSVGSDLPRSIPADLHDRIRAAEEALSEGEKSELRWTLTWLEGRAIVTLDNGLVIDSLTHHD